MTIGSKVRTKYKFWGRNRIGTVEMVDGSYIYVRLRFKGVLIEAYDVELEQI